MWRVHYTAWGIGVEGISRRRIVLLPPLCSLDKPIRLMSCLFHTQWVNCQAEAFLVSNEGRLKTLPVRVSCLAVPDSVFSPSNFLPLLKSLLMFYRSLSAFVLRMDKLRLVRDYFLPYTRRDQPPIFFLTSLEFLLHWSSGWPLQEARWTSVGVWKKGRKADGLKPAD